MPSTLLVQLLKKESLQVVEQALVNVIPAVADLELTGDEATGRNIVLRALEEPVRQIAHNAGFEGSIVIDRLKNAEVGTGFNAATGEWVNMIDQGDYRPS